MWWQTCYNRFELVASQVVMQEASKGDPEAVHKRLNVLNKITLLEVTDNVITLAQQLINNGAIPKKSVEDAIHILIVFLLNSMFSINFSFLQINRENDTQTKRVTLNIQVGG